MSDEAQLRRNNQRWESQIDGHCDLAALLKLSVLFTISTDKYACDKARTNNTAMYCNIYNI